MSGHSSSTLQKCFDLGILSNVNITCRNRPNHVQYVIQHKIHICHLPGQTAWHVVYKLVIKLHMLLRLFMRSKTARKCRLCITISKSGMEKKRCSIPSIMLSNIQVQIEQAAAHLQVYVGNVYKSLLLVSRQFAYENSFSYMRKH